MIRVIIYLVLIGLLAVVAVWFADRPGDVSVTWQGWRLETSVMMLLVAMATVAVVAVMLWSLAVADLAFARHARPLSRRAARRARLPRGVAGADRDRFGRRARRAQIRRGGQPPRARRAADAAARRADRAARRRRRAGRARLPPDGEPRRHEAARPARPLHRGAASRPTSRPRSSTPRRPRSTRRCRLGPARRCSNSAA